MALSNIAVLIGEATVIGGALIPIIATIRKLIDGQRCQLRSEMLKIYYHNCETESIHQYEYENFAMLCKAYKALNGNSFVDKIWHEIQDWEIITRRENKK